MRLPALLAAALVLNAWGIALSAPLTKPERLNILWLIAEDFGPHLSCYGTPQVWTPQA